MCRHRVNAALVSSLPLMSCLIFYSLNGEDVRLMLWDTAGQEEFDSLTSVYYRGKQTFPNVTFFFVSINL